MQTLEFIGTTIAKPVITINGETMDLKTVDCQHRKFRSVYPDKGENNATVMHYTPENEHSLTKANAENPIAYLPVFPGTNCDYDTARAFRKAGASSSQCFPQS